MIFVNNMFWYTWDTFTYWGDENYSGMKPHMYDNWFSKFLMSNPIGMYKYYDVFSVQGFRNWFTDALLLQFIPGWELYKVLIRQLRNDWSYDTVENNDSIDMNRLFIQRQFADPYDYNYWSSKEDGIDCNGNVGNGYYCFCPSQGYNCQCQPNDWYAQGQVRNLCNDHYGYDCNGNYVDGETNWCSDQTSIYW